MDLLFEQMGQFLVQEKAPPKSYSYGVGCSVAIGVGTRF